MEGCTMTIGKADPKQIGEAIETGIAEKAQNVATATPQASEKEGLKQQIYIGPNLPGLTSYTVIDGEGKYPVHIKKIVDACAAVGKLFVPVDELSVSSQKAQVKGTLEYRYVTKVNDFMRKQGE